ncbi:hypothetical protein WISP_132784 [Willisornis vidua]|uniref:Uncharacterized protein n=1 Tax=Willisornis vidua TaxID=1566151 RepID=A0ABQ9CUZ9_9PASS|nr:hypothetical protein WISP_132784 [Willisornis vidua]
MASTGKRQRRRRRRAGQPEEGDAQEKEDSVKSPDYVERLACKYMQKCTVESSTESESESKAEVMLSPLAGGLKKAKDSRKLQFLDPYDGDSEDASVHSDCSLNSLNIIKVAPWTNRAPKARALEDADTSDDGEPFPNPPDWFCPAAKVSEVQTVNGCKAPLDLPGKEEDFLLQSPELPLAAEEFSPMWLTPDCALLMSISPSASMDLLASPADSAPQPPLEAPCDGTMAKQTLNKRKQEIPTPEGASEKLRRKKFRVT